MDLRDHITGETSAFVERLVAAAETAIGSLRSEADAQIARLREEIAELRKEIEAERARATELVEQLASEMSRSSALEARHEDSNARLATLATELDGAKARITSLDTQIEDALAAKASLENQLSAHALKIETVTAQLESETSRSSGLTASLDSATNEIRSLREMLESARAEAIRTSEALEAEGAQRALLQQEHETSISELRSEIQTLVGARTTLAASLAEAEAKAQKAAEADRRNTDLQQQVDELTERLRAQEAQVRAAEDAVARMKGELTDANAIADAASAEMTALKGRGARVAAILAGAATSMDALSRTSTVTELFEMIVRELATEFSRAAIFRVKGNHLEGELAAGLDDSVDIQKIVVPLGLSSVLTKAATGQGVQHAATDEIGDSRPPFGGAPELVVAAPLVFDGEVLAVAYADSGGAFADAHIALATVLTNHANTVLVGLSQELKTSRQLRDYARTLLAEIQRMFEADVQAPLSESARLERLRANIAFAHDLYAERAALETPLTTNLLDDEIGRMMRGADASSPFAAALAQATSVDEARRVGVS